MRGNDTPGRIVTNFCTGVGVHDVITSANFYDCRLWGLSVVRGSNFGFLHWLSSSPLQHSRTTVRVCDMCLPGLVKICRTVLAKRIFVIYFRPHMTLTKLTSRHKADHFMLLLRGQLVSICTKIASLRVQKKYIVLTSLVTDKRITREHNASAGLSGWAQA